MKVPCIEIARLLKKNLKKKASQLKKKKIRTKLITILVGESPEQLSFVKIKQKVAKEIGVGFEFIHLKKTPTFFEFINLLKEKSGERETTGVIVQQPLPSHFPPLGLAVLTVLKYIFQKNKLSKNLVIENNSDAAFFKQAFKHKKIVLVGRGATGGQPIGKTLSEFKINYININSQTHNPEQYYKEADVIITAVGRKVLSNEMLKHGVVLVNVGLRREGKKLKGDYDEKEVKKVASYYTETPKGTGPIDVLYLYKNLLDAADMQKNS